MRCKEVRRSLAELSAAEESRDCGADIRAHVAGCPACAQHVQAQAELSFALRDASVSDQTDDLPFTAVRSLVEGRAARITHTNQWSTIMSRIARSFARPAYMVPSVVAVAAVLFLTLFPWKVDQPGGYKVAFAGVDKDLALQQFGVQRVLVRLGISDAHVEVGDCEASCDLTITDLRDEAEVGKVVSAMFQLSDCELLEISQDTDVIVSINIPQKKTLTFDMNGNVACEFVNELSKEDLAQIEVVVSEVRFGDGADNEWTSDNYVSVRLADGKNGSIPCGPVDHIHGWSDEAAARGETLKLKFDACLPSELVDIKEIVARFGDETPDDVSGQLSKPGASSAPIDGFSLNQNYPNPFNASTTITFSAPEGGGPASLEVYNIRGQLVKTLVDHNVAAGMHEFTWDATDSRGNQVASGIYLYRLRAGDYVETKEMALLK